MEVRVLGPLELVGAPGGARTMRDRERALLAALALEIDSKVSHADLTEALWPGDDTSHAGGLKTYVMRLRKIVGPSAITTTSGGYRLSSVDVTLDAASFEQQVTAAMSPSGASAAERAWLLTDALEAWRGRPYDELGDWPPVVRERRRLDELRHLALEARSEAELDAGCASIAALEQLVEDQPLRERRWQQLMLALYRAGRQADALRAYERARNLLRDELGLDPGPDLAGLEQAILRQDPSLERRAGGPIEIAAAIDAALDRGQRRLWAGEPAAAVAACLEGAALARQIGDMGRLLRCAIGASGEGWNSGLDPYAAHVQLLEEAVRLPASYSPLRAQVLARLSVAQSYHQPSEVTRVRALEALELARLIGEPGALAVALEANLIVDRDLARSSGRERWVDELDALVEPPDPDGAGPVAPWVTVVWARAGIDAARGDVDRAIDALRAIERNRCSARHPLGQMIAAEALVLDASRHGDWRATVSALETLFDAGRRALVDPAATTLAREGALGMVERLDTAPPADGRFEVATFPVSSGEVMILAEAARSADDTAEGRRLLARLTDDDVAALPRDLLWPTMVWMVAEAAQTLEAAGPASALYRAAVTFGPITVINPGGIYLGSMEHHLGVLAATMGEHELAARHFDAAIVAHLRAGATEWIRRSHRQLADLPARAAG